MINLDIIINSKIPEIWNSCLNKFMTAFTHIGDILVISILSLIVIAFLIYKRKYLKLSLFLVSMIGGLIIGKLIKIFVERTRPQNSLVIETGYSFPSGHALMATIFFILLIYLFKDEIKNKTLRILFILINILFILTIAFSRIYLNVHWFSDVFWGLIIGLAWIIISIPITTKLINPKILKKQWI